MDIREQISTQTNFALTLTNHLLAKSTDSNLAISPVSLHAILSVLAVGSKGSTQGQILSFVGSKHVSEINDLASQVVGIVLSDGSASGGPMLRFGNGVWLDSSLALKKEFGVVLSEKFKAEAKNVDFQTKAIEAANEVNSWVDNVTTGLIKELLPPGSVDSTTRLILGNALYFKGVWENKFNSSETKDSDFYLLNGSSIQVPYMTTKEKQFISSYDEFSVLKLPYKQGGDKRKFSMYIFLPHEKDGLQNLSVKLSSEPGFLDHHLPRQKVLVENFKLPKFKISFGIEASEVFKSLGLTSPFDGNGDLTEMVESSTLGKNLYVSSIFHKSFIEVNEEGTEAAAASAAVIKLRSIAMGPFDFVADHPFLFVIREDMTGVLLFTGHIINPLLSE